MGTFGKALGSFGAYIACSHSVRNYLTQSCGGLIYSTAIPPPVLGSILAALDLLPLLEKERAQLQMDAQYLREQLGAQGWGLTASTTQIVPILLGEEGRCASDCGTAFGGSDLRSRYPATDGAPGARAVSGFLSVPRIRGPRSIG